MKDRNRSNENLTPRQRKAKTMQEVAKDMGDEKPNIANFSLEKKVTAQSSPFICYDV